jgi:thiol-disulfide isomerase/thioredoxin
MQCNLAGAEWAPASKLRFSSAPNIELNNLNGKTIHLQDYKGKVVLVNFWATWCESCKEEFSKLIQLQEKYGAKGLVIVAVNLAESKPKIKTFLKSHSFPENTFEIVLDNSSLTYKEWKARGIPTSYLVNQQGRIQEFWVGTFDADDTKFIHALEKALQI